MSDSIVPDEIASESISAIRTALRELKSDRDQTEQFFGDMFDAMEAIRGRLLGFQGKVDSQREDLEQREGEVQRALQDIKDRANSLRQQEEEYLQSIRKVEQMDRRVTEMARDRDEACRKLDEAVEQLASMPELIELLETTQAELDASKKRLQATKRQMKELQFAAEDENRKQAGDEEVIQRLQNEKTQLEDQLRGCQRELSELKEVVAEQSEELASRRKKWSGNLGAIKGLVEEKAKQLKSEASLIGPIDEDMVFEDDTNPAGALPDSSETDPSPDDAFDDEPVEVVQQEPMTDDPVLGSVLAQLEELDGAVSAE